MTSTLTPDAPDAPPSSGGGAEPTAGQVARRRWRASRGVLAVVLAVVAVAVILAVLRPGAAEQDLDPQSPGRGGTRALAEILRQRGTPVAVSRSAADAAERATAGSVTVVTWSGRLTRADIDRLRSIRGDLLLVAPTRRVLHALAPGVEKAGTSFEKTDEPGCALRAAALAGKVRFGRSETYLPPSGATACYRDEGKPRLVQVALDGGARTVTVLGSPFPLTNEFLDDEGNAALAMNLVGARSSVVWLIPDLPEPGSGSGDATLGDLVPFGVKLFFLQLVLAVAAVAVWRARRLGPVVAEPLPVVVRSAETVEGRARLYRAHRARGRAADALRAGARERLVPLLGLPRSAAQDPNAAQEVVAAVAERVRAAGAGAPPGAAPTGTFRTGPDGRLLYDEATIGAALYGPEPADDAGLVWLSDVLDDLERQVRQS
ncbi:hypothetical protein Arub01_00670 [Actinomadura rubrobrunea]|uniref:DUF4350 domain-containing protein n=1 Tax=Actinomadura rubrobrunea TaxID=115335 RepID=A0A9W6PRU0_9ACTN|nr:DUF4350 domain-containing protein [Actinomadura rubrobrunea]GLW61823.1 hypothetical protein Arub01_00670 [Actinomadura rubrobrunea]